MSAVSLGARWGTGLYARTAGGCCRLSAVALEAGLEARLKQGRFAPRSAPGEGVIAPHLHVSRPGELPKKARIVADNGA